MAVSRGLSFCSGENKVINGVAIRRVSTVNYVFGLDVSGLGHFRITFSLFLKASLGAHHEISFTCKSNSFSYEWLCTRPRFDREALGNSEMVYLCHEKGLEESMTGLPCCTMRI